MARTHDPGRAMDIGPNVPLVGDERLAGVDPDSDAHGSVGERLLGVSSRGDRIGRARERDKERVALSVDLDPSVPRERVTEQLAVLRKDIRVTLAELVQQTRRAFDVGEEQRHRSARKSPHAGIIPQRRPRAKSTMSAPATAHRR